MCVCVCARVSFLELWEQTSVSFHQSPFWTPAFIQNICVTVRVTHTRTAIYKQNTHLLSLPWVQTRRKADVSFSHRQSDTRFPWSAVLSPPQGSGCHLVHSKMGMTRCLCTLPHHYHNHQWDLLIYLITHSCRKEVGLCSHRTHTQQWRISVTF